MSWTVRIEIRDALPNPPHPSPLRRANEVRESAVSSAYFTTHVLILKIVIEKQAEDHSPRRRGVPTVGRLPVHDQK